MRADCLFYRSIEVLEIQLLMTTRFLPITLKLLYLFTNNFDLHILLTLIEIGIVDFDKLRFL